MSKNVKNVESDVQVFTFSTLKLLTNTFTVKQLDTTYTYHVIHTTLFIILITVHSWLKYNGFATVRKTLKLIEGGHRGFQDYRHTSTFFTFFYVFLKIQKSGDFLRFFAVLRTFSRTMRLAMQDQMRGTDYS